MNPTPSPAPRRRRFRLSVRALIAAVAVAALVLAGWHAYFDPVLRWRRAIRDDNDGALRWDAMTRAVYGKAAGIDPGMVLGELASALHDPSFRVRQTSAEGLGRLGAGGEPAVPALVAALKDAHPWVRAAAAGSLHEILKKDDRRRDLAVPGLVAVLTDRNLDVRLASACTLVEIGEGKAAAPALIALLPERNDMVRMQVLRNLGRAGDAALPAVPLLLKMADEYSSDPAPSEMTRYPRVWIAEALARLGEPDAARRILLEVLNEDTSDPAPTRSRNNLRVEVAKALAHLGEVDVARRILIDISGDPDPNVRRYAADASRRIEAEAEPKPPR